MVRLAKRLAVLAVAGTLTATSLTGCGTINTDETVATVGDEKITLGVANFYARLQQAQYETYYASMMGTTAEEMWAKEVSDNQTYEEQTKKKLSSLRLGGFVTAKNSTRRQRCCRTKRK